MGGGGGGGGGGGDIVLKPFTCKMSMCVFEGNEYKVIRRGLETAEDFVIDS